MIQSVFCSNSFHRINFKVKHIASLINSRQAWQVRVAGLQEGLDNVCRHEAHLVDGGSDAFHDNAQQEAPHVDDRCAGVSTVRVCGSRVFAPTRRRHDAVRDVQHPCRAPCVRQDVRLVADRGDAWGQRGSEGGHAGRRCL
eukprot:363349-Chlamydomonas_euryale.AAC.5